MKSNSFFTRFSLLVFLFAGSFCAYAGIEADSIKPLTKVNKEFLIVVHIVLAEDSTASVSESTINNQIAVVNSIFEPIGISFKVCEFRYIYNFQYDFLFSMNGPYYDYAKELKAKYAVKNRINMYYCETLVLDLTLACGFANLGGISSTSIQSGVFIAKGGCNNPTTIAHEFGHYFSLPHTFENAVPELVNGSNCHSAGDGICDTPADPYANGGGPSNYVNSDCVFYYTGKDANGEFYDPDVSNIMGYYSLCRCFRFSHDQYEKMAQYYLSNPFVW